MRRAALIIGALAVVAFAFVKLSNQSREPTDPIGFETNFDILFAEINQARADCEKEGEGWRYRECLERNSAATAIILGRGDTGRSQSGPSPSLIARADAGDPEASLEYGYHLVAKALVEKKVPHDAIPYLMTAAMAGDIGAHVQIGLIESVTKEQGDLVKAWAHFDVALQGLTESAPDYPSTKKHHLEIYEALSVRERAEAIALSKEFRETMRANGNALK